MFQELQMINLPHENMLFFHRGDIISYLFMAQSLNQLWDRVHRFFLMAKIKWDQQVYDGWLMMANDGLSFMNPPNRLVKIESEQFSAPAA